jgi:DNA-directed RNA polymerase beta' subunit
MGEICTTFEAVFNKKALDIAETNPSFREFIINTAIDSCIKAHKETGEKLSKDYKLMKNLKCKGGFPSTISFKDSSISENKDSVLNRDVRQESSLERDIDQIRKEHADKNKQEEFDKDLLIEECEDDEERDIIRLSKDVVHTPKYILLESTTVDLGD